MLSLLGGQRDFKSFLALVTVNPWVKQSRIAFSFFDALAVMQSIIMGGGVSNMQQIQNLWPTMSVMTPPLSAVFRRFMGGRLMSSVNDDSGELCTTCDILNKTKNHFKTLHVHCVVTTFVLKRDVILSLLVSQLTENWLHGNYHPLGIAWALALCTYNAGHWWCAACEHRNVNCEATRLKHGRRWGKWDCSLMQIVHCLQWLVAYLTRTSCSYVLSTCWKKPPVTFALQTCAFYEQPFFAWELK